MKKLIFAIVAICIAFLGCQKLSSDDEKKDEKKDEKPVVPVVKEEKAAYKFIGVKKCAICHRAEAKGNQYKHWQESAHAQAYQTLGTPKAKEIAAKLGLTDDPQKIPQCLKCHVTGSGEPAELTEKINPEDGVQCESCHGAGQDYGTVTVMKNRDLAIAKGLVIPTEAVCVKCHNKDAPGSKPFDFAERVKIIAHPRPK